MPVLDGNIDADGLSDARSLAASMRGGGEACNQPLPEDEEVGGAFRDTGSLCLSGLCLAEALAEAVRGGGDDNNDAAPRRGPPETMTDATQTLDIGFQPIPGILTFESACLPAVTFAFFSGWASPTPMPGGMMSPPPVLVPTPLTGGPMAMLGSGSFAGSYPGLGAPLLLGQGLPATPGIEGGTVAYTYVPVPMYSVSGLGQPSGEPTPAQTEALPETGVARAAYQQAFLQNAVAQNVQIQQQLMLQNRALSQLLNQSGGLPASWQGSPLPSLVFPGQEGYSEEVRRRTSAGPFLEGNALGKADSKRRSASTPNAPQASDLRGPPLAPALPKGNHFVTLCFLF